MERLHLEIVTGERIVSSQDVDVIVAPGEDGELTVLAGHAPLLTTLKPGEMLVTAEGDVSYIAISGGFLEVLANKVIVLADTAERSDEIDIDRAEAALKRAQDAVIDKPEQVNLSMALASIRKSQARVKVARRRTRLAKGIGSKGSA